MQLFGKNKSTKQEKKGQAKKEGCGSLFRRSRKRADEPVTDEQVEQPDALQAAPAELVPRLQLEALSLGGEPTQEHLEEEEPASDGGSDCSSVVGAAEAEALCMAALRQVAERAEQLTAAARAAMAHRSNCLALATFGERVVAVLEAKGPLLLAAAADDCLPRVASLLGGASALAASCSAPGWVLTAASNEACTVEGMNLVHAQLSTALKEHGLDSAPGLRLPGADYLDGSRSLLRRLRVLGSGSLHGGLTVLAGSEDEQCRLGEALGVEPEEVARDAAHILAAGLVQEEAAPASLQADALATPGLHAVFAAYACFGAHGAGERGAAPELDSFRCAKLVREAGLLSRDLTLRELDVMFVRAKERGARRLTFAGFVQLLSLVAGKRDAPVAEVVSSVLELEARGPERRATTPEAVRFHDDRTTYTGVHKRGGMKICDDRMELRTMVDRDAAEKSERRASLVRTFSTSTTAAASAATPPLTRLSTGLTPRSTGGLTPRGGGLTPRLAFHPPASTGAATPRLSSVRGAARSSVALRATPPASHAPTPSPAPMTGAEEDTPATTASVKLLFETFGAWGRSGALDAGLDSKQFVKLMRDANLLGRGLNITRVDLIFAGVVGKGARRMGLTEFYTSLPRLAEARRCSRAELVESLCACEGPTSHSATTPQTGLALAERSNFTGIAARGGPSTLDARVTLEGMVQRT